MGKGQWRVSRDFDDRSTRVCKPFRDNERRPVLNVRILSDNRIKEDINCGRFFNAVLDLNQRNWHRKS